MKAHVVHLWLAKQHHVVAEPLETRAGENTV